MNTSPFVSVIIPNYNRADRIQKAVESVLAQTWNAYELIVVDDTSTDDSADIVRQFLSPQVRLIVHPKNKGVAAAWNTGIRKAKYSWVALLDSDDTWQPEKLATQIEYCRSHPETTVLGTGYHLQGIYRTFRVIPNQHDTQYRQILYKNILHPGTTFLVQKQIFERVGLFDESLRRGQDTDWVLRCAKSERIQVIPQPLATIHQHTGRSAAHLEQSRIALLEKYHTEYASFGKIFLRRKSANMWADVAYQYEREENRRKMRQYATKSIAAFPLQPLGIYLIWIDAVTGWQIKKRASALKSFLLSKLRNG